MARHNTPYICLKLFDFWRLHSRFRLHEFVTNLIIHWIFNIFLKSNINAGNPHYGIHFDQR